jgi:hypothetical protein
MRIGERLASWSLARQFAVAGGGVMLAAMLVVGSWVSAMIEAGVVRNTANATALYMESVLAPLSQELAEEDRLSQGATRALEEIFDNTPLGERVAAYKIWKPGGLIAAASDPELIGRRFEPTRNLREAWGGEVRAEFEDLVDAEDARQAALGVPLLEIYSPVRELWSGEVIAVAEFYEVSHGLAADLAQARRMSWLAVAGVLAAIGGLLHVIVLRGSRTIDRQKAELSRRLADLAALSDRNTALRLRVQGAAARASAMNDHALRRIGADLHDGPAQHLGFAALRLDNLADASCPEARQREVAGIAQAVQEALRDIRQVSRGLSLPDIERRGPCEIAEQVIRAHEARTETRVGFRCACDAAEGAALSAAAKICLYRFVQEGLNNAWQHGGGAEQSVDLSLARGHLRLSVSDRGPGPGAARPGLGLSGLRDRVESLGGRFRLAAREGGGAELTMELEPGGNGA